MLFHYAVHFLDTVTFIKALLRAPVSHSQ